MKISNTNDFSSAVVETYNTVKSWALSAGDGLKTVYAWFKDTIGNWNTAPYSDTISLETSGDDDGGGGGGNNEEEGNEDNEDNNNNEADESEDPSLPYPNGSLLTSVDDEKIYFIVNNQRRWISSTEVFHSYGLTPNTEIVVDSSVLNQYPLGRDIDVSSLQEGTLIRGKNAFQVYIIKPPYKRHIFNPAVFGMYQHFSWESIQEIEADIVNSYITSDIYRSLNDYRVYSLEEVDEVSGIAVKHHLNMTAQRFTEKGYNWNQIFVVNEEERDYYETGADEE